MLFPLIVALLRSQARRPSDRIWLAVPLLALWSNLHGAALSGLALLYAYLALSRWREDRRTAIAVAVVALLAMCVTPAGIRTVTYYYGLVTNLAAERGVGQWAPIGGNALDVMLVLSAIVLGIRARRKPPQTWELAVIVVLAALTIKAARDGVWLLFFLVAPASHTNTKREWNGLLPIGAAAALALFAADVAHWSKTAKSGSVATSRALALAHGTPILADGLLAERVAIDRGRIWAGNPIDAFSRRVQGLYLDWLAGSESGRAALADPQIRVVLVTRGSDAQKLTVAYGGFVEAASAGNAEVYVRRPR
jgi:hypothetical protein